MIIYNVYNGYRLLLLGHITGSTLYNKHTLPYAIISGGLALIFGYLDLVATAMVEAVSSATLYLATFNFLAGFIIVYRSQLAITRFRDALDAYTAMSTKVRQSGIP